MPPVGGRELKHLRRSIKLILKVDAPCAGARIETIMYDAISIWMHKCPLCGGEN